MYHITYSAEQQAIITEQILSKAPNELNYIEKCVFMKKRKHTEWIVFPTKILKLIDVPM